MNVRTAAAVGADPVNESMSQLVETQNAPPRKQAAAAWAEDRLAPLLDHPALRAARELYRRPGGSATLSGLTPAAKGFAIAAVAVQAGGGRTSDPQKNDSLLLV